MSKTAKEVIFEYADGFNFSDRNTSSDEPDVLIRALGAAGFVIVPKDAFAKSVAAEIIGSSNRTPPFTMDDWFKFLQSKLSAAS